MARRIKTSLMAAAAVLLGAAPLAAQMPGQPGFPASKIIGFDVHEGTSMSVSVSPDGRMLAVDLQGSLWIVPARGGRARRITDYFNDARQPVWSPDGKSLVYFAYRDGNYDLWTVSADGTGAKKLTDGVFDDREPAFSPDGKFIAFSSDRAGQGAPTYNIWTMEIASGKLRQITADAFEDRMPTWSPDGREIAYSSPRDKVNAIWATSLADGRERMLRQSASRIDAPSWGPKGQLVAITSDDNGSRLEMDGVAVSGTENVFPFRPSWVKGTSDFYYVSDGRIRKRSGKRTATIDFTAHLEVTRPDYVRARHDYDSTAPRRALGIERPMISPDGSRIAFVALGDLYVASVKGGTPENLTKDHAMDSDPAWSPDGGSIVYTSDKSGGLPQLWIRDLKTGRDRKVTNIDTQPLGASWSPDGDRVAYIDVDGRWGVAGVCVIDVRTGKITRLQASLPQPGSPSWSADGKYVAISLSKLFSKSFREGTNQLYVIPTDGKSPPFWQVPDANVGIDTRGGGGPAWSPDGTKMAAIYEGLLKIWPVSPEGAALGPMSSYTSEIAHYPTWTADSRKILYQSNDKLKTIDVETGKIAEIPFNLTYTLAKPTGRTVIHAGALVDSVRDVTQANKDIVIDGNRIVEVRDHDPALHAAAARVVDGTGLTAIPGLIEHHAHSQKDFGAASHRAWLAYGITTVRDPGNQVYYGIEDREAQEAGVRIGPRFYTNGPLLEWQRVYYKMGVAVSGPAHLERELERARILHHDIMKSYVRMPDLQQRRIVEAAHAMGVPVTGHEIFPAAFVGVDATEHMGATSRRGYSPKQGPQGRAYEDVIQLFGKSQRTVTPTLFGSLTSYLEKNPAFKNDPRVKLYPLWAQESVASSGADFSAAAAGLPGALKAVKDMWDAGALVTAGTDTTIAINLLSEIAAYVDAGLTPFQALQSVTVNPARSLNLDAGTIEPGKLADIVLIQGDPRQNIANTFNVRKVVMNGRPYDMDELLNPTSK
ncbi:MAG: putative amidohydrolase [Sphingomonas bacterium]|nr:LpqB family beta-propeller domain-containing protein [Sphingomonas bacterium]MDB5688645.1 putative amidohydrolase [Sphingomonas bacterium]